MKHSVEKATAETEEKLFKLFLTQTAKNLLNLSLGVRVHHNFLPWSFPVRNLPIASNTRDFPDNIHVKTTYRLESLHNLMSTLQRWLQSLDPLLTRTWLLTSCRYNLSLSNYIKRNKVYFHSVTVTQSIFPTSPIVIICKKKEKCLFTPYL